MPRLQQRLIDPDAAQHHSQHHKGYQDTGRGQGGIVDEQLAHSADQSAHKKGTEQCFDQFHGRSSFREVRHTAWAMDGMDSPCWVLVGLSKAPVAANSTRLTRPSRREGRI